MYWPEELELYINRFEKRTDNNGNELVCAEIRAIGISHNVLEVFGTSLTEAEGRAFRFISDFSKKKRKRKSK